MVARNQLLFRRFIRILLIENRFLQCRVIASRRRLRKLILPTGAFTSRILLYLILLLQIIDIETCIVGQYVSITLPLIFLLVQFVYEKLILFR